MPGTRRTFTSTEIPVLGGRHDQREEPDLSALDSQLVLDGLGDAVVAADDQNRIIFLNPAAERLLGWQCEALVGERLSAILPERLRGAHVDALTHYIVSRRPGLMGQRPVRVPALRRDGSEVEVDLTLSGHQLGEGAVLVAFLHDLTDRVDLEREQLANRYLALTRDLAVGLGLATRLESLADGAPLVLDVVGAALDLDVGLVWGRADGRLVPLSSWARPGLEQAAEDLAGIGEGLDPADETLPGGVLRTGQPVWVCDLPATADPQTRVAAAHGLHTTVAFPVTVHGEVEGVVEFFLHDRHPAEVYLMVALAATGAQVGQFIERWRARHEARAAREHLIELAEALRASLLPPKLPQIVSVDLAAAYHAAGGEGHVGGDFYDVFPLGNETWGVTIGDVCGRGPHAAALTALARHTIRTAAIGGRPPVDVLHLLNDAILTENRERGDHERFLTALYLTVRPGDDGLAVEIANAGHPLPLHLGHDGGTTSACGAGDLLGVFPGATPARAALTLGPRDALVAFTDGVVEARDAEGVQLGEHGIVDGLHGAAANPAKEIVDRLERVVLAHTTSTTRADDLAIICLKPA